MPLKEGICLQENDKYSKSTICFFVQHDQIPESLNKKTFFRNSFFLMKIKEKLTVRIVIFKNVPI